MPIRSLTGRYNKKHVAFGHVVLILLLLTVITPRTLPEKLTLAFLLAFLVSYGLTEHLYQSVGLALGFVCLIALIEPPSTNVENFEEKKLIPAGEDVKDASIKIASDSDTLPVDTLTLNENELEDLLKKDEKPQKKDEKPQKKDEKPQKKENFISTGITDLDSLLKLAKKDADEHIAPERVTPAQAQRQTHQLIDTVKQLKETMESMVPLLTSGKQIMDMYKSLDMPELGIQRGSEKKKQ